MKPEELRIALFSGNYNYVRDGANQALNRLVDFLLRQGARVRIYAPIVKHPAFPPTGDMVNVPAFKIPRREEYRVPYRLDGKRGATSPPSRPTSFTSPARTSSRTAW